MCSDIIKQNRDKAKKEFPIDNGMELKLLKTKWLRKDDAGRTIKPFFFGHLAKNKGYYNNEKKNYLKHDTSMDYLVTLINGHRLPFTSNKSLNLVNIIDFPDFNPSAVKYEKINQALSLIKRFDSSSTVLWDISDLSSTKKYEHYIELKKEILGSLSSIYMNRHTLYWLIKTLDESTERGRKKYAVTLLFNMGNKDAFDLILKSKEPVASLVCDPDGPIELYGANYSKIRKKEGLPVEVKDKWI